MTLRALRAGVSAWALLAGLGAAMAGEISDDRVTIGVLTDMSGIYSAASGEGVVDAVKMAVADYGGTVAGKKITVVAADHQNKTDVGAAIAAKWFDADGVDVIVDVPNSAVALAVQDLAKNRNRVFIGGGAVTSDLTGKACSPNGVQYIYDTYSMAATAAKGAAGKIGKSFYFLTVDYTFGHAMQAALTKFLEENGATVVGAVRHPLGAPDLSSFLLQAQGSGADVIVLASAGGDSINAIKTANEFGVTDDQKILGLLIAEADIAGLGLDKAQGMLIPTPFYWTQSPESVAWAEKFAERNGGRKPSFIQAGAYSYTTHYLKALDAAGTDAGRDVVAKMKEIPVNDWFAKGTIRPDGRMVHDMYLVRVKSPAESKQPWDFFELVETIPGDQAFRPLADGGCPLVTP